jgi:hypothetical protein
MIFKNEFNVLKTLKRMGRLYFLINFNLDQIKGILKNDYRS